MPITFAPQQPFNAGLAAAYGSGQVSDALRARQSQENMQRTQLMTQASIASAQNMTSANNSANAIEAQMIQQQQALDYQRQSQQRQFEAARMAQERQIEAQREQQLSQFAFQGQLVSQQERQRMVRMQDGLSEALEAWNDGSLSDAEYHAVAMELKTGINFTQRRLQNEQAENQKAQAAMRDAEAVALKKTQTQAEMFQLEMARKGITVQPFVDQSTGRIHMLGVDPTTGKLYNPFLERSAKGGSGDGGESGDEFSYKKALPEIKAQAEATYPTIKDEKGKDINAQKRADFIAKKFDEMGPERYVTRMKPPDERGISEGSIRRAGRPSQAAPPAAAQEPQEAPQEPQSQVRPEARQIAEQLPGVMQAIAEVGRGDEVGLAYANSLYEKIREIATGPRPDLRQAEYDRAIAELKKIYREAMNAKGTR